MFISPSSSWILSPTNHNKKTTLPFVVVLLLCLLTTATSTDKSSNSSSNSLPRSSIPLPSSKRIIIPAAFQPHIMRAWHCHGRNQKDLVDRLTQAGIVHSPQVRDVLRLVDRQNYVSSTGGVSRTDDPGLAYMDAPQSIGSGQTISAPHMHAHALEEMVPYLLKAPPGEPLALLDVGCGSGYLTACMGRWIQARPESPRTEGVLGRSGKVYGMDIYPHLVQLTENNLKKDDGDLLRTQVVSLQVGNGWNGWPEAGPFDAIHVGAAAADFPRQLAVQLKVGGVLIVPVGPLGGTQYLYRIERIAQAPTGQFVESDYRVTELLGVRYVPLVNGPN